MATRLRQMLATGDLDPGAQVVLNHALNVNGTPVLADEIAFDNADFDYVAMTTMTVTVINRGGVPQSANVRLIRDHSIDRVYGSSQVQSLSPQPFVIRGAAASSNIDQNTIVYDGADLQNLIDDLTPATPLVYSDRVVGTHTILFPMRSGNAGWDIGDIDVPANISVQFVGTAPMGSWLNYVGSRGYMFRMLGTKWGACVFENLTFLGGGLAYDGGVRRHQGVYNCVFQDITTGPAIRTLGASVIDVRVQRCWFNRCGGGVHVLHGACDIWVIDHCIFNRNTDVDVKLDSSGVCVVDCNFETRNLNNLDKPYIHITFGQVYIVRNRFGPEVDPTVSAPQYGIVVGSLAGQDTGTIPDVYIDGNNFEGTNPYGASSTPYPDDSSSKAAIRLSKALAKSTISNNHFRQYASGIVHEDWLTATPNSSSWIGNRQSTFPNNNDFVPPVFFGRTNYADGWMLDDGISTTYGTISPGVTNNLVALGFGPWTQQVQIDSSNGSTITGFNTGVGGQKIRNGQRFDWLNASAFNHTFNSEDLGSTDVFRIRTVGGAPLVCPPDGIVTFWYDPSILRFRVVGKNF